MWLTSLHRPGSRRGPASRPRRTSRPVLRGESLEDRTVPSTMVLYESTQTVDSDNDGTVDSITTVTEWVNNHGHALSDLTAIDADADGTVDYTIGDTRSFNRQGDVVEWELVRHGQFQDLDWDETRTYDVHGNMLRRDITVDRDADGTAD